MQVSPRAQELFLEAQSLDPKTRSQFVTDVCGKDQSLIDEVNSLLTAANESEAYFERLSDRIGFSALTDEQPPLPRKKSWAHGDCSD